jgi:hypothetical protein
VTWLTASRHAYAGRALAYRSLDDEASALRDEQTVREFGGVKPPAGEFIMLLTPDYHLIASLFLR